MCDSLSIEYENKIELLNQKDSLRGDQLQLAGEVIQKQSKEIDKSNKKIKTFGILSSVFVGVSVVELLIIVF